ncbi:MAG: DNA mismatch repair protein MutS, partial [Candidatus Dormibacteraeota bacterium]|nr:DNA mismatch repair protein MutS [Candidatus Dormibacteraeota bacterium]
MKALLMHRDRDFDPEQPLPANEPDLTQDLELNRLLDAMAQRDEYLREVARRGLLWSLAEPEAIRYRQEVLQDCLRRPQVATEIYNLAVDAIVEEKKAWLSRFSRSPDLILHRSVSVMAMFLGHLSRLRRIAEEHAAEFHSEGLTNLFRMLVKELDDDYFLEIREHLRRLQFREGVLISARLGKGNQGTGLVLRRPRPLGWRGRLTRDFNSARTFRIADRDEAGHRALAELRDQGVNLVANALAQSVDHVLAFFRMLRAELGFYMGCLNLHRGLAEKGEPACFPEPVRGEQPVLTCRGLYDPSLSLGLDQRAVGNSVDADGRPLVMITGANRGGKSTFLRSLGQAQLMMQSGMFVAAESFRAGICTGVFTHFKREEDAGMRRGKLDEELSRMSDIADRIGPGGLLLCNESFASTNEREGSEIARQIVSAMLEASVRVIFVTHMFDLAQGFHRREAGGALFLRAERRPDGRRTFRLLEGEP